MQPPVSGSGVHSKPNLRATPKCTLRNNSHRETMSVDGETTTKLNRKIFELLLSVSKEKN